MKLLTRSAALSPRTYDKKARSIRTVAFSDSPVQIFDWDRGMVDEVLLISGAIIPQQVRFLDSHKRESIRDIAGRATHFTRGDHEVEATIYFGKSEIGRLAEDLAENGDLDSVSIGYRVSLDPNDSVYIPEGESTTIEGRTFEGPVLIRKRYEIKELSAVIIPADENAKFRGNNMPDNTHTQQTTPADSDRAARIERERITAITAMCERFGCSEMSRQMIDAGTSIDEARSAIMDKIFDRYEARQQPGFQRTTIEPSGSWGLSGARITADEGDKRRAAVIDGLLWRGAGKPEDPAPGANEYVGLSLLEIARECVDATGGRSRNLTTGQLCRAAMTTDFPYLLKDAAKKLLLREYRAAGTNNWRAFTRILTATDFKDIHVVNLSEVSDLEENPEGTPIRFGDMDDAANATYAVKRYAKRWALTEETIRNDDLAAFLKIPRAIGRAGSRLVNETIIGLITANGTMLEDSTTLFHADHSNLVSTGSGGPPSITTLDAARKAMRLQTGIKTDLINIVPRYMLVPAALETTSDQFLNSMGLDDTNPAIRNPFYQKFTLLVEPILDSTSTTGWYLIGDPAQNDCIHASFLDGVEEPIVEVRPGWEVHGVEMKGYITFGAAVADWRPWYHNAGA